MNHSLYLALLSLTAIIFLLLLARYKRLRSEHSRLDSKHTALTSEHEALRVRYAPVIHVDEEATRLQKALQAMKADYAQKKTRYDELVRSVAAFDEEVELAELGFYKPHFDFDTSERFKTEIRLIKDEQKRMVQSKLAIICETQWHVERSRTKGETMVNRAIRLTARAFNNECDAAIAKVRWNNVRRMELRIEKAFAAINKANATLNVHITPAYLDLKLTELRLTHEYREKKHEEREHQAELRRQEREEAQLRKDAAEAAKEESRYAELLAKAKADAATASAEQLEVLTKEITNLSELLADAHEKSERALSMAQQTRSGYVYVVSNVGSFGESVYKIGMTRRLDPMDRVRELSAASVPFVYDAHAMVYSEDAPGMEAALHRAFEDRRINKVNPRKEFFRVTLDEVKGEVERLFPHADFVEDVEARDFKETRAIEERLKNARSKTDALERFPDEL